MNLQHRYSSATTKMLVYTWLEQPDNYSGKPTKALSMSVFACHTFFDYEQRLN